MRMMMNSVMAVLNSSMDKVTNQLFIGSMLCLTPMNIRNGNIKLIVDCTVEGNGKNFAGVERFNVPVDDTLQANISNYFDAAADKIEMMKRMGGNVLVHCVAGVSRSSTICLAYLMKHGRMRLRQAYNMLKSARAIIRPNENFFKQLIDYEYRLFGGNSVNMVPSPFGMIPDLYKNLPSPIRAPFNPVPTY